MHFAFDQVPKDLRCPYGACASNWIPNRQSKLAFTVKVILYKHLHDAKAPRENDELWIVTSNCNAGLKWAVGSGDCVEFHCFAYEMQASFSRFSANTRSSPVWLLDHLPITAMMGGKNMQ